MVTIWIFKTWNYLFVVYRRWKPAGFFADETGEPRCLRSYWFAPRLPNAGAVLGNMVGYSSETGYEELPPRLKNLLGDPQMKGARDVTFRFRVERGWRTAYLEVREGNGEDVEWPSTEIACSPVLTRRAARRLALEEYKYDLTRGGYAFGRR